MTDSLLDSWEDGYRESRGPARAELLIIVLLVLLSSILAVQAMILVLNRSETEDWNSQAEILCNDLTREVQSWLERASDVEPKLPPDRAVTSVALSRFQVGTDAEGGKIWCAFVDGALESGSELSPLLSASDTSAYSVDPESGYYDFGKEGRAAASVQVRCLENALPLVDGGFLPEYVFQARVTVSPVSGGEGIVREFTVRPLLDLSMRESAG